MSHGGIASSRRAAGMHSPGRTPVLAAGHNWRGTSVATAPAPADTPWRISRAFRRRAVRGRLVSARRRLSASLAPFPAAVHGRGRGGRRWTVSVLSGEPGADVGHREAGQVGASGGCRRFARFSGAAGWRPCGLACRIRRSRSPSPFDWRPVAGDGGWQARQLVPWTMHFSGEAYQPFRKRLLTVVRETVGDRYLKVLPDDAAEVPWMSAATAATRLGFRPNRIIEAVASGEIEGRVRRSGFGHRHCSVSRDTVAAIEQDRARFRDARHGGDAGYLQRAAPSPR